MPVLSRLVVGRRHEVVGQVLLRRDMVGFVVGVDVVGAVTEALCSRIVRVAQVRGDGPPFSRPQIRDGRSRDRPAADTACWTTSLML